MPYLERLKELPDGYHAARIHSESRTWISAESFPTEELAAKRVSDMNALIENHDWTLYPPYFVWHR